MKNKFITVIAVLALAAGALSLTACGGGNNDNPQTDTPNAVAPQPSPPADTAPPAPPAQQDAGSRAAGIWVATSVVDIGYGLGEYLVFTTLHATGEGFEEYVWVEDGGIYLTREFTWSAADGIITYHIPDVGDISSEYNVTGDILTMAGDAGTFIYQRVHEDELELFISTTFSDAVGVWAVTTVADIGFGEFEYLVFTVLRADGLGSEEYVWVEDGEIYLSAEFTWAAQNGLITYFFADGSSATSSYSVVDDVLTMTGDAGTFRYERVR
ncbi:MAG: hypothetical protein FWC70_03345 [Defluviitaleaceae bacterium]|nr:hypothetical protein [Defluviitaleaceae bacterium]